MKSAYMHIYRYKIIYIGVIIHFLFYISAAKTGWFGIFFSGPALHQHFKGINFYQILRGAWAYQHGGSLTGKPLANSAIYAASETYYANINAYHPFFTLAFGSFLLQFGPVTSYSVWLWSKLAISLLVVGYFYWSFRSSKYVQFAVFVLLVNFSDYLELAAGQFEFLLNMFLLLFLINLVKKRVLWSSLFYCLSMLVSPIGLCFVPVLLFKGRWRVALIALLLFARCTVPFLVNGTGTYYTDDVLNNILYPLIIGPDQAITFNALLHYSTYWPAIVYQIIEYTMLGLVVFLSTLQRIHISKAIFLYIIYSLLFYDMVYEYNWSMLAYIIAVCVVILPEFQTRLSRFFILLTCLPSCFLVLRILHIDVSYDAFWGYLIGTRAWQFMVISKLVPALLLCCSVLASDVIPIYKQLKSFIMVVLKTKDDYDVVCNLVMAAEQTPPSVLVTGWWAQRISRRLLVHRIVGAFADTSRNM